MSTNSDNSLVKRLFQAGAHFGFRKSRRHPTVTPYLFTMREGVDIFDLEKTAGLLESAKAAVKEAGANGKKVLLVGTKDEISHLVHTAALEAELPYVINRWIGGLLTNFAEIKQRLNRLEHLLSEKESGEMERKYTKKEGVLLNREINKLQLNFGGIRGADKTPDMLVVIDPRYESIAVAEAKQLNIPVVAVMSSDCDLGEVTYPVVVNDSLQASVALVLTELVDAYKEGAATYVPKPVASTGRGGYRGGNGASRNFRTPARDASK